MLVLVQGISFRNLAKLSDEIGQKYEPEFLQELINIADMDNDGRVCIFHILIYCKCERYNTKWDNGGFLY